MSMNKDLNSIVDILKAIENIMDSVNGVSFIELDANLEKQAAIFYFLIIIGEATKRLSKKEGDSSLVASGVEAVTASDSLFSTDSGGAVGCSPSESSVRSDVIGSEDTGIDSSLLFCSSIIGHKIKMVV